MYIKRIPGMDIVYQEIDILKNKINEINKVSDKQDNEYKQLVKGIQNLQYMIETVERIPLFKTAKNIAQNKTINNIGVGINTILNELTKVETETETKNKKDGGDIPFDVTKLLTRWDNKKTQ
jgi:hypothetical protein